jgi:hypothetical protein
VTNLCIGLHAAKRAWETICTRAAFASLFLILSVAGCVNTRAAVLAQVEDDWGCPREQTQVQEVSYATYRLDGCARTKTYQCNFAMQVPRCWPR